MTIIDLESRLTREEEIALAIRIQESRNSGDELGEEKARSELFQHNVGLIYKVLKKMRIYPCPDYEEFVSSGRKGLWKATVAYNPNYRKGGIRFSTCASTYINQEILRDFRPDKKRITTTNLYSEQNPGHNVMNDFPAYDDVLQKLEQADLVAHLYSQIGTLPPRDQIVLMLRLNGKTLEQIGEVMKLTRERIRQIQKKALEKLRFKLRNSV